MERHRERLPERVRRMVLACWTEAQELEARMVDVEKELKGIAEENAVIRTLVAIPGIGTITATALFASVGNIHLVKSGRPLASWLGIMPREYSSGSTRRTGRISMQGNPSAHPAHPRRPLGTHRCTGAPALRQAAHAPAAVGGAESRRIAKQQPGRGGTGEQAGEDLLGSLKARAAVRRQLPAAGSLNQCRVRPYQNSNRVDQEHSTQDPYRKKYEQ
jgi:hypothetical protein